MKTFITSILILFAVGCGKPETEIKTATGKGKSPLWSDEEKILGRLLSTNKMKSEFIASQYSVRQISCIDLYDEIMKMLDEDPYSLLKGSYKIDRSKIVC